MPTPLQPGTAPTGTVEPSPTTAPEAGFEGLEEVSPESAPPSADAGFEGLKEADQLDLGDEKTLMDDDSFRPAEYLAANPDVAKDGEKFQKLMNVYRARRVRGLEVGKVAKAAVQEAPGIIGRTVKGAAQLASRAVDIAVNPAVNEVLGLAEYIGTGGKSSPAALRAETRRRQLKAASEISAGTETAVGGLAQLATQGKRKLFDKSPDKLSDSELEIQLREDAEFHKALQSSGEGEGDLAKSIGLDAELLSKDKITLDKDAIQNLSLVDPLTLVGTAGVFKVVGTGGKILATAASKAGAQAVLNGLSKVAARSVSAAGRTAAAVGRGVQKVPIRAASAGAVGAQVVSGNVPGAVLSATAPALARAGGRALEKAGQFVAEAGTQLHPEFVGPRSAAVTRLAELASSAPAKVATTAAKGALGGAVASAPLAAAAQDSETAGALLGGGTALGTVAGAAIGGKHVLADVVAKKYLDPHSIPLAPVESKGYGIEGTLDQTHEAAIAQLPEAEQNAINNFREALRDQGGEIYVQDPTSYLERVRESLRQERGVEQLTPEDETLAKTYADTHANLDTFRTDAAGNQRRIVFLNSDAKGLPHDAGHLFQSLLAPERQAQLRQAVFDSYTPQQLEAFGQKYTELLGDPEYFKKLGPEAGRGKIADEIIAENFSQLFGNSPLSNLKAKPQFLDTLARTAVEAGEALGLDLTSGRTTPDLNVAPAYRLQNILRNASHEVLNLPKAAEKAPFLKQGELDIPATKEPTNAPTAEEVATPAAPKPVEKSAARAQETGIEVAKLLTEDKPEARAIVDQISQSMEAGNPALRIEHRGITAEPEGAPRAAGRSSRRGTQEAGYAELERLQIENRKDAPESVVQVHEKTFVPIRWTEQGGKATLIAASSDKVIANLRRVVADATSKKASDLIPYENADGKLTEAGWNEAMNDFRTYAENQSHGYRGDGQKLVRPGEEAKVSIPAEDPGYTPKPLDEAKANFLNLVQGIAPPKTSRSPKGQVPGNVKGQMVAEANLRTPEPVARVSAADLKKQTFAAPFEGRTIKETNPLRNQLEARGVNTRNLLEVTERFAADDIASVGEAAPEAQFKAPVTDTIRGGFLPKEAIDAEVKRRVEEAKRNGIPVDERKRKEIQQKVEFDARNGRIGQPSRGALLFLPKEEELAAIRNGTKDGETFNADGTPFVPAPGQNLDVVTLASVNVPVEGLTEAAIAQALGPFARLFKAHKEIVKSGVFRMSTPGPDGKPQVSIDLNVVSDQANRANSTAFAKANNQEAIFDLTKKEVVPTGGNGQTALKTPSEVSAAIKALRDNKLTSPDDIARQVTDNKPVEVAGDQIMAMSPDEWRRVTTEVWDGGLTNEAYRLGLSLKDVKDVETLARYRDLASEKFAQGKDLIKTDPDKMDEVFSYATKSQFFSEAYQAATGSGSAKRGVRLNGYTEPFPFPKEEGAKFLPRVPKTQRGAALGQQGYEFEVTGQLGNRGVSIYHNGDLVGEIMSSGKTPDVATVNGATIERAHRGRGVGEAAYRELLAQLKADGVKKIRGTVVAPEPLALRRKIFGDENTRAESPLGEDTPPAAALEDLGRGKQFNESATKPAGDTDITFYDVENDIKPEMSFLPKKRGVSAKDLVERDERGRPLTAEGLVDYERLYKEQSAERKAVEAADMAELEKKVAAGKYSAEPSEQPPTGQLTGWLLPNEEFVPLDTAFHEQWLAKNAKQLNEDFGTKLSDKANVDERADALQKGFVRVRYTPNDGTVRIEASAKAWTPSVRRALLEQLGQHADSIDRVYAAVTDEKGNIVDSATEKVMDLDGVEKPAAFKETLDGLNAGAVAAEGGPGLVKRAREGFGEPVTGSDVTQLGPTQRAFLPKAGTKEFDAYTRERIRESRQFPEAIPLEGVKDADGHYRSQYGGDPLFITEPWDFNDSPLAKENQGKTVAESEELYTDALAKKLEGAYAEAKKNPEVEAGETWYSVAREKIQTLLGDDAQFFAELLGATSPNTAVDVNFGYAVEAYNLYKRGYYDKIIAKYREGKEAFKAGETAEFEKETGKTGKKVTEKAFLTWWAEKHNLEPTSDRVNPKTGKPIKFGFHTQPVLRVLDRSWLQQVEGPKTPNFTGNLSGATFQATIDVWAARLLRRLSFEGKTDKPWRILPIAEQGVGERDFYTGQKAFRKAADALGVQPDALQAILWFAEKDHWEKNGWTRAAGKAKADYNVLLQRATKTPEGQLQYVKPGDLKRKASKKVDNTPELPNLDL